MTPGVQAMRLTGLLGAGYRPSEFLGIALAHVEDMKTALKEMATAEGCFVDIWAEAAAVNATIAASFGYAHLEWKETLVHELTGNDLTGGC